MGERKKPKKYSKMGYQQKEVYVQNELKKLGGEGVYYTDDGSRGSHGHGMFDLEKSQEQLKRLASNDYDRRESLKYGVESGDKRFSGLDASSGFNSMESLVNTDRAIAKYGINVLGNNKMKEKDGDYASVSNSLFNKSREAQAESITDEVTNDINGLRDEIEANRDVQDQATADPQSFENSDAVSKAQDNLEKYKLSLGKDTLFAKSNDSAPRADDQADATASFANKYKDDVKEASNLGEAVASNLNNAMDTVKSYRPKDLLKLSL